MATGGQDGNVVVWKVALPRDGMARDSERRSGTSAEGGDDAVRPNVARREGDAAGHTYEELDEGSGRTTRSGIGTEGGKARDGVVDRTASESAASSLSGLSDDVGSVGRGSADLNISGKKDKERTFSGIEVRSLRRMSCILSYHSEVFLGALRTVLTYQVLFCERQPMTNCDAGRGR